MNSGCSYFFSAPKNSITNDVTGAVSHHAYTTLTYCGIYLVYLALGDRSHGAQLTGTLTRARICLVSAMIKLF